MRLPNLFLGAGRCLLLAFLAALLAVCLWMEVTAGVGTAWSFAQPGQFNGGLLALWFCYAACGPACVVVTTARTRSRLPDLRQCILRIEKWGIIIALPLAIFGLYVVAAHTVI